MTEARRLLKSFGSLTVTVLRPGEGEERDSSSPRPWLSGSLDARRSSRTERLLLWFGSGPGFVFRSLVHRTRTEWSPVNGITDARNTRRIHNVLSTAHYLIILRISDAPNSSTDLFVCGRVASRDLHTVTKEEITLHRQISIQVLWFV